MRVLITYLCLGGGGTCSYRGGWAVFLSNLWRAAPHQVFYFYLISGGNREITHRQAHGLVKRGDSEGRLGGLCGPH